MQAEAYAHDREIAKKRYLETLEFRRDLNSQIQALMVGHIQNAEEIRRLKAANEIKEKQMRNWNNLVADENYWMAKHYAAGGAGNRSGRSPCITMRRI